MNINLSDTIKFIDSNGTEINAGARYSLTARVMRKGWYLVIIDFQTGEEYLEEFFDKCKDTINARYNAYLTNDEVDLSKWVLITEDDDD